MYNEIRPILMEKGGPELEKIRHSFMAVAIFLFVLVCAILSLLNTGFRRSFLSSGTTPETHGLEIARQNGCFFCHGPSGAGKAPNPGGDYVPGWQIANGNVKSEADLEAWILDGAPQRLKSSAAFQEQREKNAIHMPAYRKFLNPKELKYLIAYYNAVSGAIRPVDPKAARGLQVARDKGCFTCHGEGGRIDMKNPHSITGAIPAWSGPDYAELVESDEELRGWILDGGIPRLQSNFFMRRFTRKQALSMPAYRGRITEEELEALVSYIHWLRSPDAPGHESNFTLTD